VLVEALVAQPAVVQARLKLLIRQTQPYAKRIAHKGVWVLFGDPKAAAMKVVGIL
jgi:hypothetical protein